MEYNFIEFYLLFYMKKNLFINDKYLITLYYKDHSIKRLQNIILRSIKFKDEKDIAKIFSRIGVFVVSFQGMRMRLNWGILNTKGRSIFRILKIKKRCYGMKKIYEEDKGDYFLLWKNSSNFHGMIFDKKNIGELRLSIEKYLRWYKIAVKKNHNIGKMIMTFKPAKCYTTHEKEMSWGIANCGGESAVLFMTLDGPLQKHMYFFEFAAFTTESGKVSPGLMFLDFASVNHLKKLMSENHLQETLKIIKEYK